MADGRFLIKFDGKESVRCYATAFDYDLREYMINNAEAKKLPADVENISIVVEQS